MIPLLLSYTNNQQPPVLAQISPDDPSASQYIVAYPNQYQFILDEPNRCQQERPFLVLMIPVAPHNGEARNIIRNTWGKEITVQGQVVSHYFLLGLSKEEGRTEPFKEQVSCFLFEFAEFSFMISSCCNPPHPYRAF